MAGVFGIDSIPTAIVQSGKWEAVMAFWEHVPELNLSLC